MLLKCWPDFELQHDLVKAKNLKKIGNLPWQHKLLLRITQKNVETRKITEKTHQNAQTRRKPLKTAKHEEKRGET